MRRHPIPKRLALPKVIVVSEGEITESLYLNGVRIERRIQKERLIIHPAAGDPRTIVLKAIAEKEANEMRNKLDRIDVLDPVWAVFDRDEHNAIPEAKTLATNNGINIAFSNPNFELFLLLHFEDCNRDEHRDDITKKLKKYIPTYDKYFDYEALKLSARYPEAKRRAGLICSRSEIVRGIHNPPYCSLAPLVDYLRAY
jgi:hypothetical protein